MVACYLIHNVDVYQCCWCGIAVAVG